VARRQVLLERLFQRFQRQNRQISQQRAQQAAQQHGVDWRLLAAMGYQESKWDPHAVSFTGVRGLMQLTEDTASRMRAGDRRDPRSSIFGAAKYLAMLMRDMPRRIPEPDRTWFAVAAYNVGLGHVEDARVLAQQAGRNPDRWEDVREFLPLLSQERHLSFCTSPWPAQDTIEAEPGERGCAVGLYGARRSSSPLSPWGFGLVALLIRLRRRIGKEPG